jgi:DNA-binding LacI/PurR family transcriptional regulator
VVTSSRVGALYLSSLSEMKVPIVLINNQHSGAFVHGVMIANREASRLATAHLTALGHRRIAYIGDRNGYHSDTERCAGYREALGEANIPFDAELVVHGDGKPEGGLAATAGLLKQSQPPTAIFCYNDMTALGALRSIHDAGQRVPRDISVVGFDDLFLASYTEPPLTTVRQPMRGMGELAMQHLLKLMSGSEPPQTLNISAELVIRKSTAPPRKETR